MLEFKYMIGDMCLLTMRLPKSFSKEEIERRSEECISRNKLSGGEFIAIVKM